MILLGACNLTPAEEPTHSQTYVEMPYKELFLKELDQDILASPGMSGCSLADLRPFGPKISSDYIVDFSKTNRKDKA